jgi:hypothetical protein
LDYNIEGAVKVNGKKHWLWTWQSDRATYIAASTNRGTATINKHVANVSKEGTLVHDFFSNTSRQASNVLLPSGTRNHILGEALQNNLV